MKNQNSSYELFCLKVIGPWLTWPGNGVAYSTQAPGLHGPGYRLAGSLVSCRQLETPYITKHKHAYTQDSCFNNWMQIHPSSRDPRYTTTATKKTSVAHLRAP